MELSSLLRPSPPDSTRQGGAGGWCVASGSPSGAQRSEHNCVSFRIRIRKNSLFFKINATPSTRHLPGLLSARGRWCPPSTTAGDANEWHHQPRGLGCCYTGERGGYILLTRYDALVLRASSKLVCSCSSK